jgi:anti-sigma factor ChrR (cupin superfamily)
MDEHPSLEELRRFAEGALSTEDARIVVAHFMKGCQTCSEETAKYNLSRMRQLAPSGPAFTEFLSPS